MDPIQPIAPGASPLSSVGRPPVARPDAVSRERDRPEREAAERRRRRAIALEREQAPPDDEDRGPGPHIDVTV